MQFSCQRTSLSLVEKLINRVQLLIRRLDQLQSQKQFAAHTYICRAQGSFPSLYKLSVSWLCKLPLSLLLDAYFNFHSLTGLAALDALQLDYVCTSFAHRLLSLFALFIHSQNIHTHAHTLIYTYNFLWQTLSQLYTLSAAHAYALFIDFVCV